MPRFLFLSLILCGFITADVLPYKPEPVIWVHGLGSNSETWGAGVYKEQPDSLHPDSIVPGSTYDHFLNDFMLPIVYVWNEIDPTYTTPQELDRYPNKTFLEVINFDWNNGSIDAATRPDPWPPYCNQPGQGWELRQRIKEVLTEYYGPNWQDDPEAKVILICHSMASLSARQALREEPALAPHIKKIVTLGGTHNGSYLVDGSYGVLAAYAVCAIVLPWFNVSILDALGVSCGGLILPLAYNMNAYHDATWDLRTLSGFVPELNDATQTPPPGIEWACLVGRDPWPAGLVGIPTAEIGAALLLSGQWVWGGVVIASGITFEWWNHNSDLMVQTSSQDIVRRACPNYQRELIEDDCLRHSAEPGKWRYIRDFLEPPVFVSIDSAIVFSDGVRTAYALPNENNVIEAPGDSLFLKGKTNIYFLATPAEAGVSLNGSGYLPMQ